MGAEGPADRSGEADHRSVGPDDDEYDRPTAELGIVQRQEQAGRLEVRGAALVVFSGASAGREIRLETPEVVIGRDRSCGVCLPDDGVSREHARVVHTGGRTLADHGWTIEDLGSTNGTVLNGERVEERRELHDGDRLLFGQTVVKFSVQAAVDQEYLRQLYELSVRDALTQLYNRRFLDDRLRSEAAYARRHGTRLTLLMVDIDHFKTINDRFGHPAGDKVLREVADDLQRRVRTEDVVARFGGEEFCLLAREIPAAGALALAERIRLGIEALAVVVGETPIRVTVSIGAVTATGDRQLSEFALLAEADRLLYEAKAGGRNRTRAGTMGPAGPVPPPTPVGTPSSGA